MIDNALKIVANEANKYLLRKIDPDRDPSSTKRVVLGNIAKSQDTDGAGGKTELNDRCILSLVNLEEERINKNPNNYVRVNDKIEYRNPKIYLNLYCLFAANYNSYETALQYLSLIIQFFQYRNVIDHKNTPPDNGVALDVKIDKLIFDLVSLNAEQINHLWAVLGGKYIPSVLYKVRMVTIEDDTAGQSAEMITSVGINN